MTCSYFIFLFSCFLPQFGLGAIQLARGLGASKVVGTAGTEKGQELVEQMGADEVLDYKSPDFKRDLRVSKHTFSNNFKGLVDGA